MKLSESEVKHVAKLAKLTLSPEETPKFRSELTSIINFIEELKEVDVSEVEPTSQTTGLIDVLREDSVDAVNILPTKSATSQSRQIYNDFFVVPAVIDKNE